MTPFFSRSGLPCFWLLAMTVMLMGARSVAAQVSVVGTLTRETPAAPGQEIKGTILIKNSGAAPSVVKVYQHDYEFKATGENYYKEPGTSPRSNARWTTFSPTRITLAPGATGSVAYTIQVPSDPKLKGSYWSIIMVEPIPESSPERVDINKNVKNVLAAVGVQTLMRYGIQLVTNMGKSGSASIKFLDKKLVVFEGKQTLQLDVENAGERVLRPMVWVEMYNQAGALAGRFESSKARIYPGCSVRHRIKFEGLPKGTYKAMVVVDNGDESVFGSRIELALQ